MSATPLDTNRPPVARRRVLLVEDEPLVRDLVREVLEARGYDVSVASDPEEALRLGAAGVDLLVTDVVMPGMNGRELADRLAASHPALKVLYLSGYSSEAVRDRVGLADDAEFLQKPFSLQKLELKVSEILG